MVKKEMTPQSCKSKGRRLQQRVAERLLQAFSQLHKDDIRSNPMGADGEDIWLSKAARVLIPFTFECKNVERLSIWRCIEQAKSNQKESWHTPAVVFAKNHEKPYIALPFETFMEIYQEYVKNSNN